MTDPVEPRPQPEHVVNAATVGGLVSAVVSAAGMYFVFFGVTSAPRVAQFSGITAGFITAAVTLIAGLAPYVAALRARNKVTPITRKAVPRDAQGRRLVPETEPAPPPRAELDRLAQQWDADFRTWQSQQTHHDDTQEIPRVTDEPVHRIPSALSTARTTEEWADGVRQIMRESASSGHPSRSC